MRQNDNKPSEKAPSAEIQLVLKILTIGCSIGLIALMLLFIVATISQPAKGAVSRLAPGYPIDHFKMVQWCAKGPAMTALYETPDGQLWTWLGAAWSPVKPGYSASEFCDAPSLQTR